MTIAYTFRSTIFFILMFLSSGLRAQSQKEFHLKLDLDSLLPVAELWKLTPEAVEAKFPAGDFKSNPYLKVDEKKRVVFDHKPFTNVTIDITLFGGRVPVEKAILETSNGKVSKLQVVVGAAAGRETLSTEEMKVFRGICENSLNTLLAARGEPSEVFFGNKSDGVSKANLWKSPAAVAMMDSSEASSWLSFVVAPPGTEVTSLTTRAERQAQVGNGDLFLNLDMLLSSPDLWTLTPAKMEQLFMMAGFKESPYFKWLTTDKTSARFARRPYSNVSIDLSMFGRVIPVEEMVLDFKDGRASQMYVSLYNRGDSGDISKAEFDTRFKLAGQFMSQLLAVKPLERRPNTQTAVKTSGWLWTAPNTLALLEYNADAMGKNGGAEFMRLRLTPPAGKDQLLNIAAIGQTTTTLSRSDLPKFVHKEASGDVYISGIPMVDQGDKGYCVVASCQRLFSYLHIPCDQHELAEIAGSDAGQGTSIGAFALALDRIDNTFKVRFKPLLIKSPNSSSPDRNARPDRFAALVQEYVDKGIPLLWSLQLGLYPEVPAISMQTSGGHMRLMIGYNLIQQELIFSDSWGAGHEMKRMKMTDALKATYGVFLLEPKAR